MTHKSYPLLGSVPFTALVFAAACGLTACAADEDASDAQLPPIGFTQDGSTVVTGTPDAGVTPPPAVVNPTPDAGTVTPTFDAGARPPLVTADTGVVVPMGDAAVVMPTSDAAAPDAATMMRPDQGMGDGKDVITIGDSWMNLDNSVGIQQSLEKASKRDYRNFGVPGTKLLDNVIPQQYTMAKMQGPVKTVIMTGGGNDVLQDASLGPLAALFGTPGCLDTVFNAACKTRIDEVAARLEKLWAEMAKDGVQDVVIIAYTNKALGGEYKMSQAYSTQKITPVCNNVPAPLRCSSVETDMVVPDATLRSDTIHPDDATYDKIGAAIWAHMQKLGMRR